VGDLVIDVEVNSVRSDSYQPVPQTPDPPCVCIDKGSDWFRRALNPGATEQPRQRSFEFDFACLRRQGGCRASCEPVPSASIDAQARSPRDLEFGGRRSAGSEVPQPVELP
jgi:hypothetical protein